MTEKFNANNVKYIAPLDDVRAPFSEDQVRSLNAYQASGVFHPFTCGNDDCPKPQYDHSVLIATENGWICERCGYTQDWAHRFMADWSWKQFEIKW